MAVAALGTVLHRRVPRRHPRGAEAIVPALAVASWAVISASERRRPFRAEWNRDQGDTITDIETFVSLALPRLVGLKAGAAIGARLGARARLDRLPSVLAVPVAIGTPTPP